MITDGDLLMIGWLNWDTTYITINRKGFDGHKIDQGNIYICIIYIYIRIIYIYNRDMYWRYLVEKE